MFNLKGILIKIAVLHTYVSHLVATVFREDWEDHSPFSRNLSLRRLLILYSFISVDLFYINLTFIFIFRVPSSERLKMEFVASNASQIVLDLRRMIGGKI